MRVLTERLRERELDTRDGIKVLGDDGWVHVLPDPAEPLVHVYAEGRDAVESQRLESEFTQLVEAIIADDDE
jgi:mannose-1-phosphate guanylyltransferase / phosphomannomutase